ncbi:MAG: hypothetical protein R2838_04210 [Caldilineaceae bacterium]
MLNAFILGALAQSSLLLSGLAVYWIRVPTRVVGWLAGFGAGTLISAVAFDLIAQDIAEGIGAVQGAVVAPRRGHLCGRRLSCRQALRG